MSRHTRDASSAVPPATTLPAFEETGKKACRKCNAPWTLSHLSCRILAFVVRVLFC